MPPPKVILLTGAPGPSSIDAPSCTVDHLDGVFCRFLGIDEDNHERASDAHSQPAHAAWRSLPLVRQRLHSGFTQSHDLSYGFFGGHADFFTTADASVNDRTRSDGDEAEDVLTQFCEQSLAAHHSFSASELDTGSLENETSFMTTSSTANLGASRAEPLAIPSHLSDLGDIPSAPHIVALNPQTVTLNLIVGIISIAQPRSVTTRWGKPMRLVEALVGDETKSGFAVTFWLSSGDAMDAQVSQLRRQDVVLMQNVGLHVFRGKVYGQSLRRGLTRVSLLWRRDGGGHYSTRDLAKGKPARHPQQDKTRQVKDWVLDFVGGDPTAKTKAARKSWDRPPDDTQ